MNAEFECKSAPNVEINSTHFEINGRLETVNKKCEFDSFVVLNVGGKKFLTSISTLTKYPDSMLGVMFSGRHTVHKDKDGCISIHRDGTHFRHILNFLRDSEKFSMAGLSAFEKIELKVEAEYYYLDEEMFNDPSRLVIPTAAEEYRLPNEKKCNYNIKRNRTLFKPLNTNIVKLKQQHQTIKTIKPLNTHSINISSQTKCKNTTSNSLTTTDNACTVS